MFFVFVFYSAHCTGMRRDASVHATRGTDLPSCYLSVAAAPPPGFEKLLTNSLEEGGVERGDKREHGRQERNEGK